MAAFSFTLTRNDISPALTTLAAKAKNPSAIFRSMGTTFKSITEGNFNSVGAALRAKPWPAKKDGSPATLKKKGVLSTSFHLEVSATSAKLSNPMIYSAHHQFGSSKSTGRGSGILPRPFYPVLDGKLTPAAERLISRAGERALALETGGTVK